MAPDTGSSRNARTRSIEHCSSSSLLSEPELRARVLGGNTLRQIIELARRHRAVRLPDCIAVVAPVAIAVRWVIAFAGLAFRDLGLPARLQFRFPRLLVFTLECGHLGCKVRNRR